MTTNNSFEDSTSQGYIDDIKKECEKKLGIEHIILLIKQDVKNSKTKSNDES